MLNAKKKILVADDDSLNLEVVLELLDGKEYEVLYAHNGKIACEIAESELPDLIILDWQMPVMNGIEATMEIRESGEACGVSLLEMLPFVGGAVNMSNKLL